MGVVCPGALLQAAQMIATMQRVIAVKFRVFIKVNIVCGIISASWFQVDYGGVGLR